MTTKSNTTTTPGAAALATSTSPCASDLEALRVKTEVFADELARWGCVVTGRVWMSFLVQKKGQGKAGANEMTYYKDAGVDTLRHIVPMAELAHQLTVVHFELLMLECDYQPPQQAEDPSRLAVYRPYRGSALYDRVQELQDMFRIVTTPKIPHDLFDAVPDEIHDFCIDLVPNGGWRKVLALEHEEESLPHRTPPAHSAQRPAPALTSVQVEQDMSALLGTSLLLDVAPARIFAPKEDAPPKEDAEDAEEEEEFARKPSSNDEEMSYALASYGVDTLCQVLVQWQPKGVTLAAAELEDRLAVAPESSIETYDLLLHAEKVFEALLISVARDWSACSVEECPLPDLLHLAQVVTSTIHNCDTSTPSRREAVVRSLSACLGRIFDFLSKYERAAFSRSASSALEDIVLGVIQHPDTNLGAEVLMIHYFHAITASLRAGSPSNENRVLLVGGCILKLKRESADTIIHLVSQYLTKFPKISVGGSSSEAKKDPLQHQLVVKTLMNRTINQFGLTHVVDRAYTLLSVKAFSEFQLYSNSIVQSSAPPSPSKEEAEHEQQSATLPPVMLLYPEAQEYDDTPTLPATCPRPPRPTRAASVEANMVVQEDEDAQDDFEEEEEEEEAPCALEDDAHQRDDPLARLVALVKEKHQGISLPAAIDALDWEPLVAVFSTEPDDQCVEALLAYDFDGPCASLFVECFREMFPQGHNDEDYPALPYAEAPVPVPQLPVVREVSPPAVSCVPPPAVRPVQRRPPALAPVTSSMKKGSGFITGLFWDAETILPSVTSHFGAKVRNCTPFFAGIIAYLEEQGIVSTAKVGNKGGPNVRGTIFLSPRTVKEEPAIVEQLKRLETAGLTTIELSGAPTTAAKGAVHAFIEDQREHSVPFNLVLITAKADFASMALPWGQHDVHATVVSGALADSDDDLILQYLSDDCVLPLDRCLPKVSNSAGPRFSTATGRRLMEVEGLDKAKAMEAEAEAALKTWTLVKEAASEETFGGPDINAFMVECDEFGAALASSEVTTTAGGLTPSRSVSVATSAGASPLQSSLLAPPPPPPMSSSGGTTSQWGGRSLVIESKPKLPDLGNLPALPADNEKKVAKQQEAAAPKKEAPKAEAKPLPSAGPVRQSLDLVGTELILVQMRTRQLQFRARKSDLLLPGRDYVKVRSNLGNGVDMGIVIATESGGGVQLLVEPARAKGKKHTFHHDDTRDVVPRVGKYWVQPDSLTGSLTPPVERCIGVASADEVAEFFALQHEDAQTLIQLQAMGTVKLHGVTIRVASACWEYDQQRLNIFVWASGSVDPIAYTKQVYEALGLDRREVFVYIHRLWSHDKGGSEGSCVMHVYAPRGSKDTRFPALAPDAEIQRMRNVKIGKIQQLVFSHNLPAKKTAPSK